MKTKLTILALSGVLGFAAQSAHASNQAEAQAKATVVAQINVARVSDLLFGEGIQGASEQTVAPADAGAAVFTVTGDEGRHFLVTLPGDADVVMTTATGSSDQEKIVVTNFLSNFGGDQSVGQITGATALKVGAKRAALLDDQTPGAYEGTFQVTVNYQ